MTRSLRTRALVTLSASLMIVGTALASPALAVDPTPAQNAMLMQASDLPASYGKATDASFTNVQGAGGLATACFLADGNTAGTRIDDSGNMYSQLYYPSGMQWNQDVSQYKSAAQSKKAFAQMVNKAVPKCTGSYSTTKGDDNVTIAKRTTVTSAKAANGVIVATKQSTSKGGGKAPYANQYTRMVTTQVGNAIESLTVISPKPITKAQIAKQDSLLKTLISRYQG